MSDIDVNGRGDAKPSTDSSLRDLNPVNNPFGEFQHNIFDANYDHSPYTSFNGSGASSGSGAGLGSDTPVHPFKLERFIDSAGNIRTRVYRGHLRYCINTFKTIIQSDTKSTTTYSSSAEGSSDTHTESAHTHGLPSHTGGAYSSGGGSIDSHVHVLGGSTLGVNSPSEGHKHKIPDLVTSNSTVDKFVCVHGQTAGQGILKDVTANVWAEFTNAEGNGTGVFATDLPVGDTFGSIFLKWKLVLTDGVDLSGVTISTADVSIHRDADVDKKADELSDDDQLPDLASDNEGASMSNFDRGGESADDRTAYFYVKLGISHPTGEGVIKSIEQITYDNINWTPLLISRAST
jgi:hypothetical protein